MKKEMNKSLILVLALVAVVALWLGVATAGLQLFDDWQTRGQFGDLFGAVNALFSGLAFAGLIYTVLLQRNELALQREELRLQRQEMAASREELSKQVHAQRMLCLATIGTVRVAAVEAEIEALKMEAQSKAPSAKAEFAAPIRELSQQLTDVARELHKQLLNEP